MQLMAQAVPTATRLPCVSTLPLGWSVGSAETVNGTSTFEVGVDGGSSLPVTVTLTETCPGPVEGTEQIPIEGGCVTYRATVDRRGRAVVRAGRWPLLHTSRRPHRRGRRRRRPGAVRRARPSVSVDGWSRVRAVARSPASMGSCRRPSRCPIPVRRPDGRGTMRCRLRPVRRSSSPSASWGRQRTSSDLVKRVQQTVSQRISWVGRCCNNHRVPTLHAIADQHGSARPPSEERVTPEGLKGEVDRWAATWWVSRRST